MSNGEMDVKKDLVWLYWQTYRVWFAFQLILAAPFVLIISVVKEWRKGE